MFRNLKNNLVSLSALQLHTLRGFTALEVISVVVVAGVVAAAAGPKVVDAVRQSRMTNNNIAVQEFLENARRHALERRDYVMVTMTGVNSSTPVGASASFYKDANNAVEMKILPAKLKTSGVGCEAKTVGVPHLELVTLKNSMVAPFEATLVPMKNGTMCFDSRGKLAFDEVAFRFVDIKDSYNYSNLPKERTGELGVYSAREIPVYPSDIAYNYLVLKSGEVRLLSDSTNLANGGAVQGAAIAGTGLDQWLSNGQEIKLSGGFGVTGSNTGGLTSSSGGGGEVGSTIFGGTISNDVSEPVTNGTVNNYGVMNVSFIEGTNETIFPNGYIVTVNGGVTTTSLPNGVTIVATTVSGQTTTTTTIPGISITTVNPDGTYTVTNISSGTTTYYDSNGVPQEAMISGTYAALTSSGEVTEYRSGSGATMTKNPDGTTSTSSSSGYTGTGLGGDGRTGTITSGLPEGSACTSNSECASGNCAEQLDRTFKCAAGGAIGGDGKG